MKEESTITCFTIDKDGKEVNTFRMNMKVLNRTALEGATREEKDHYIEQIEIFTKRLESLKQRLVL